MPDHDNQNLHLVQAQGGFGEPGTFAEEVAHLAEGEDVPRELREALLLRPGRGTGSPLRTGRPLRLRAIPILHFCPFGSGAGWPRVGRQARQAERASWSQMCSSSGRGISTDRAFGVDLRKILPAHNDRRRAARASVNVASGLVYQRVCSGVGV